MNENTGGIKNPPVRLDAILVQETSMLRSRNRAHLVHDYCFSPVGICNRPNGTQVEQAYIQPYLRPQSNREAMFNQLLDEGESTKLGL